VPDLKQRRKARERSREYRERRKKRQLAATPTAEWPPVPTIKPAGA